MLLDERIGRGYSSLTSIDEKTIGILYEGSQSDLVFQKISLKNILNPNNTVAFRNIDKILNKEIVVDNNFAGESFTLFKENEKYRILRTIFGSGVPEVGKINFDIKPVGRKQI